MDNTPLVTLKQELMLQVNENLYKKQVISKDLYEAAKIRIVALHS